MSRDRSRRRLLVAVVPVLAAVALGLASCGQAGRPVSAGADPGAGAAAGARPTEADPGEADGQPDEEPVRRGIVDQEGRWRGTYATAALDARDDRLLDLLYERGREVDGRVVPAELPADVREAVLVLDAVEVRDADGELAGYASSRFLTVDERAKLVPWASGVVARWTSSG